MAFLLGLVAPHALLMPSPARHAGPALKGRAAAAPVMTEVYGQQSCQQPDIGGIRSGEIGTPYPGPSTHQMSTLSSLDPTRNNFRAT